MEHLNTTTTTSTQVEETSNITVSSGVSADIHRFTWKIDNFDLVRKSDKLIRSQKFEFKAGKRLGVPTTWSVCLLPAPISKDNKPGIGIFIQLCRPNVQLQKESEVNMSFHVKINWADGQLFASKEISSVISGTTTVSKDNQWGFPELICRNCKLDKLPLVDGCLIIEVELKLFSGKKANLTVTDKVKAYKTRFQDKLSRDLAKARTVPLPTADKATKIITRDRVEFPVCRGVLSVRSPVFQAMFEADMMEAKTGVVYVKEISSKAIDVLLEYLLAGRLHKDWKDVDVIEDLLYGAHKYELPLLLEFLDEVLIDVCSIQNAKNLAVFAKNMGLKKAEAELFNYIKRNANTLEDLTLFA